MIPLRFSGALSLKWSSFINTILNKINMFVEAVGAVKVAAEMSFQVQAHGLRTLLLEQAPYDFETRRPQ